MGLEYRFNIPKTYCEKWPVGCQFCDLLLCDGKKETAITKISERDYKTCVHKCGESKCVEEHMVHGRVNDADETEWVNVKDKLPDKNKIVILAENVYPFGWVLNFAQWNETTRRFILTWTGKDYILNNNDVYWTYLQNLPKECK